MQRTIDCRGLHPPEPLVRILAELDAISEADTLEAWLDRRPLMLFPELEERRLTYHCEERADGGYSVRIAVRSDVLGAAQ